jgi:hypothetical protein
MRRRIIFAVVVVVILVVASLAVLLGGRDGGSGLGAIDSQLGLTSEQEAALDDHWFVVADGSRERAESFLGAYQKLNEDHVPIIVTTDTMLHQYHVFFDSSLRLIEQDELLGLSINMSLGLVDAAEAQYQAIADPWLKERAERVVAFFAVALRLADPQAQVPAHIEALVDNETALIEAHQGFADSPIFNTTEPNVPPHVEDYSQYVPRGHYTRSEPLKRYFKEMMWYGRQPFYNRSVEETAMAVLAVYALDAGQHGQLRCWDAWERIYGVTEVFVGESDDLMPTEYLPVVREVFGDGGQGYSNVSEQARLQQFRGRVGAMRPPSILGTFAYDPEDTLNLTKGMRIMGQRWIPDSYIFQNLVNDKVKNRMFPIGLDTAAVLGCNRAEQLLASEKTKYPDYGPQLAKLKAEFAGFTQQQWRGNLYMGWTDTLTKLHPDFSDAKYPQFMHDPAWATEKVSTHMGSWTELRHDTILYAKQSYPVPTGISTEKDPEERGYVEPVEGFYPRLKELVEDTRVRLDALDVLSAARVKDFEGLEALIDRLEAMVQKELSGKELSDDDCAWLRGFGKRLGGITGTVDEEDQKAMMVADVHTDSDSRQVLEEGVGHVDFLVVKVKDPDGTVRYRTGPVFSYYEFKQPMSDRLTDEQWMTMLHEGHAPDRPVWTEEYMT